MRSESGFRIAPDFPEIGKMTMNSQFVHMKSSSIFFDDTVFLLSSLGTGSSFMSISLEVLEIFNFRL